MASPSSTLSSFSFVSHLSFPLSFCPFLFPCAAWFLPCNTSSISNPCSIFPFSFSFDCSCLAFSFPASFSIFLFLLVFIPPSPSLPPSFLLFPFCATARGTHATDPNCFPPEEVLGSSPWPLLLKVLGSFSWTFLLVLDFCRRTTPPVHGNPSHRGERDLVFVVELSPLAVSLLLLLASRIHLRRHHLHRFLEAAEDQKQTQPGTLHCDLPGAGGPHSGFADFLCSSSNSLTASAVDCSSRLPFKHMHRRRWCQLILHATNPVDLTLEDGKLLPCLLCSHRDEVLQDGSLNPSSKHQMYWDALLLRLPSCAFNFTVSSSNVASWCVSVLGFFALSAKCTCSSSHLRPNLFICFGPPARNFRHCNFLTCRLCNFCDIYCIFTRSGSRSFRLFNLPLFILTLHQILIQIRHILDLAQLLRDLSLSLSLFFASPASCDCLPSLSTSILQSSSGCVFSPASSNCAAGLFHSFSVFFTLSRNSRSSASFAHPVLYASMWSSSSPDDDEADQLHPFLRGHRLQMLTLQHPTKCQLCILDIWLSSTRWFRNRSGSTTLLFATINDDCF